jgi:hypothetical protein
VYGIRDPDNVLDFITRGIVNGLDQAAPVKSITVKEGLLRPGVPGLPSSQKQSKAKVSHILRPGNTAFKGQLKLVNGFER